MENQRSVLFLFVMVKQSERRIGVMVYTAIGAGDEKCVASG